MPRGRDHRYANPGSRRPLALLRCISRGARGLGTLYIRHACRMKVEALVSPVAVPIVLELPAHLRWSNIGSATMAPWAALGVPTVALPLAFATTTTSAGAATALLTALSLAWVGVRCLTATGAMGHGVAAGVGALRCWDEGLLVDADQPVLESAEIPA